jgi:hypothetical protein
MPWWSDLVKRGRMPRSWCAKARLLSLADSVHPCLCSAMRVCACESLFGLCVSQRNPSFTHCGLHFIHVFCIPGLYSLREEEVVVCQADLSSKQKLSREQERISMLRSTRVIQNHHTHNKPCCG